MEHLDTIFFSQYDPEALMRAHDDTYPILISVIMEDLKTDCPSNNDHYCAI